MFKCPTFGLGNADCRLHVSLQIVFEKRPLYNNLLAPADHTKTVRETNPVRSSYSVRSTYAVWSSEAHGCINVTVTVTPDCPDVTARIESKALLSSITSLLPGVSCDSESIVNQVSPISS